MANVIIQIHGLGNKPPKDLLERWWERAMIEGLKKHNYKTDLPKHEMVYWADILHDKPLNQFEKDKESPYYLDEIYAKPSKELLPENHDTRKKIIGFLNRQLNRIFLNEDFSLNYTFITDSILGNYFKDLETYYKEESIVDEASTAKTKDLIRERLLKVLEKYKNDNIMLIAHSMGSIVAFDVLTFLADQIKIHTLITIGSPLGLPIVVSKIAAEQRQKLNGHSFMITPEGVKNNWYNFSDILDKVALNFELADDFSENKYGVKPVDFLVINNYEINGVANPHKSYGYLRTPEFSKILNEFILSERLTFKEKLTGRTNKYFKITKLKLSIQKRKVRSWFRKKR
ncbi:alpha/beta hydrolase [Labilibaculum sp.]|uniref:esterase/lipase family protein n=1 Tax=Labilibaculum sp. TaxID=2060723 RepID=UPI002AA7760C|nr:alpha/beta hydrolase [Labilibaculum sp.]MBN2596006.1 alpha/beta hydrolase [Marinifilaceae bacterium]